MKAWALALSACALSGCAAFADFAPQTLEPSPPAVPPAIVELVIDGSRPSCQYRVLGSVFAIDGDNGLEALRQRAALEGATGVYDIQCKDASRATLVGSQRRVRCVGRVYVCDGGKG